MQRTGRRKLKWVVAWCQLAGVLLGLLWSEVVKFLSEKCWVNFPTPPSLEGVFIIVIIPGIARQSSVVQILWDRDKAVLGAVTQGQRGSGTTGQVVRDKESCVLQVGLFLCSSLNKS